MLQWDPVRGELFGLEREFDSTDGQSMNVTWISTEGTPTSGGVHGMVSVPRALSILPPIPPASSTGSLGAFSVSLEDGPKAFDVSGRRAFYMLATAPLGEMNLVVVDIDNSPPSIIESIGLCGFVANCPESIAFVATQ